MNIQYVIYGAIGVTLIAVCIFIIRAKRGYSPSTKEITIVPPEKLPDPISARIFDRRIRKVYNMTLPGNLVKATLDKYSTLGRQINRYGEMLYYLVKVGEGDFKPYDYFYSLNRDFSPADLYDKINLPEIEVTHNVQVKQGLFEKWGFLLPWTIGMAVIVFVMVKG